MATELCLPVSALSEAKELLRRGLTTNGASGAPTSMPSIFNVLLQRLGCITQVPVAVLQVYAAVSDMFWACDVPTW